jgi:DNA repair exonuclease SbcCD ATPase subunit
LNSHGLVFNYIKVENFLSIGPEIHFDFNKHNGMNYVFGINRDIKNTTRNGVGKSSIFCDAILFSLFGQTSKKINKPNIVNRMNGKKCYIELSFSINGKSYIIKSGVSPTYCHLYEMENKELVDKTKSSIKETQKFISEEILKTTYDIFKNSIILSVNDTQTIFQMRKWEKRDFIENLFNLSIFGSMYKNVKEDSNSLEKQISEEQVNFNKIEEDLDIFKRKVKTFEKDKKESIGEIKEKINKLCGNFKKLETDDSKYLDNKNKLQENIIKIKDKINEYVEINSTIKNTIFSLEKDINHHNSVMNKYSNIFEIVCKSCHPKLENLLDINENKDKIPDFEKEIKNQKEKEERHNKNINKLKEANKKYEEKINLLNKKISKIENNKSERKYIKEKINDLKETLDKEKSKTSPFNELIESYTESKEISYSKLKDKLEQKKYLDYLVFALSEDGVKKYIISDLINILNNRIRKYLDEMGGEYTVVFDPNFDVTFLTSSGECEYDNFSAGERRRIDLATIFAFRDILYGQGSLRTSILVCDEILDVSIDDIAINAIINILKKESETQTVFVISHRECILEEEFENIIELSKDGGFTKIISDPQGES